MREGFVPVTRASELPPGSMKWVVIDRERVLVANVAGAYYALVEAEGHPGQGDVETHERGGPHPAELRPAHTAIQRILRQIAGVVPVDEVVAESGPERDEREGHDDQRKNPAGATAARLTVFSSATGPGHRRNPLISPCALSHRTRSSNFGAGSWPSWAGPGRGATVNSRTS